MGHLNASKSSQYRRISDISIFLFLYTENQTQVEQKEVIRNQRNQYESSHQGDQCKEEENSLQGNQWKEEEENSHQGNQWKEEENSHQGN